MKLYKTMALVRAWDERALKLQRSGRISFCVTSHGEEATQVATAAALESEDWVFPAYRQYGLAFWRGISVETLAHQYFGTQHDVSKGRQMPCHPSFSSIRFVSVSSVIGTQISQAVGAAMAARLKGEAAIAVTYFGDGATSANDFHAGLNMAGVYKAPVVFVCVNNQYAISLPASRQTGSATFAEKAEAYGFPGIKVDGNDCEAVYLAMQEARRRALAGEGPTLLELLTYRVAPHSSSDDANRYRPTEEMLAWKEKDPIERLASILKERHSVSEATLEAIREEAASVAHAAAQQAEKAAKPSLESLFDDVFEHLPVSLQTQKESCLAIDAERSLPHAGVFPL